MLRVYVCTYIYIRGSAPIYIEKCKKIPVSGFSLSLQKFYEESIKSCLNDFISSCGPVVYAEGAGM